MNNARNPYASGAVPVPNALFDDIMPTLKDTEFRLLMVVVRQTFGVREGDPAGGWRYRERDWISHSQLMRRTGRGSGAVSAAVDALVAKGLIIVEDAAGKRLATAEERRRHLGRLYFRLGEMWKTAEKPRPAKAKTTTDTPYYKKGGRTTGALSGGWQRAGSAGASRYRRT